jgi:hypothetical protein
MLFVARHPEVRGMRALYGHDAIRGYVVETEHYGAPVVYDVFESRYAGLYGALLDLSEWGLFSSDDITKGLLTVRGYRASATRGRVRRVVRVIENFEQASDSAAGRCCRTSSDRFRGEL